jgi:hypothetical protein
MLALTEPAHGNDARVVAFHSNARRSMNATAASCDSSEMIF